MGLLRALASWLLDAVSAAALGIGVAELLEFFISAFHPTAFWRTIEIIGIAVTYLVVLRLTNRRPRDEFSFPVASPRFYKFYARWYRRDGKVYVFCDELDWLEGDLAKPVRDALGDKGGRATLCVRDQTSPVAAELRGRGVVMMPIPETVQYAARLSLRSSDGVTQIIVRQTNRQREEVNVLRQTTDKYLVGMAADLFRAVGVSL